MHTSSKFEYMHCRSEPISKTMFYSIVGLPVPISNSLLAATVCYYHSANYSTILALNLCIT